ncbi:MAG: AMP-binding protein [Bdellovibrionales bacterium]|nr:AMP-binding protein [Bdellovibrionales bacterium]
MGAHSVEWLVSPHLASWQKKVLKNLRARVPHEPGTVWVLSSGTQSVNEVKCIGLSRTAIEASARAVNAHLKATDRDRWLIAIPEYHVGGYMIRVRARLSGSSVFTLGKWTAEKFVNTVQVKRITLSSLVPTQIYDLVSLGLPAPPSLRAIVVGGGALDENLYLRARRLGWPLLPSYGLTETASQVATASLDSLADQLVYPALVPLAHAQLEMRGERLWIQADSLCRWVARSDSGGQFTLEDPRRRGWIASEDIAEKTKDGWRILGRGDDVVKVLGVLVPLAQIEGEWRERLTARGWKADIAVMARPEERAGHEICLLTNSKRSLQEWATMVDEYNRQAPGPQRIQRFLWTARIPRNEMGKVKRAVLKADLF